jgi:DNA-binding response OmpR family regulator
MENIKILVADDDNETVKLISDSLEEEGFAVIPASNGEEVLGKLDDSVSFLILDTMMP